MGLAAALQMPFSLLLSQVIEDHLPDFTDPSVLERRASEHDWCPSLPVWCKHPQRAFILSSRSVCGVQIFAIRLVDHHAVNHLDDATLDPLKLIAGPGNHQEQEKVGH